MGGVGIAVDKGREEKRGLRGMECQWKGMSLTLGPDTARLIKSLEATRRALGFIAQSWKGGVQTYLFAQQPPMHKCAPLAC